MSARSRPRPTWAIVQREPDTHKLLRVSEFEGLDLARAHELWDVAGDLDAWSIGDWRMLYQYPIQEQHLAFLRQYSDQSLDLARFRYFLQATSTEDPIFLLPPFSRFPVPRFHGVFGALVPRWKGRGHNLRWRFPDGRIVELDHYRDAHVDLYAPDGQHLGEFDPTTGELASEPEPGRRVNPRHPATPIPPPVCWFLEWRTRGASSLEGAVPLRALGIEEGLSLVGAAFVAGPERTLARDRHPVPQIQGAVIGAHAGLSLDFGAHEYELRLGRRPREQGRGPRGVRYGYHVGDGKVGLWEPVRGAVDLFDADGAHLGFFEYGTWDEILPPAPHRWLEETVMFAGPDDVL